MKVPVVSSLLLMLGIASPLLAIERPKALDDKVQEAVPASRAVEVPDSGEELKPAKPSAWLGVYSQEADEALTAQLGIQGGVVLRFVAEGSPAEKAGLKVHDVVSTVDGAAVASQDDLRAAVLQSEPGSEVKMDVVSGGVKKEVTVLLAERPTDVPGLPAVDPNANFPELRRKMREMNPGGDFEQQMEEQFKQMEEQLKMLEPQLGFPGLEDLINRLPKGGPMVDMKSTGSVKLLDEHGSVEMQMKDGLVEVEVHDKEGNLLYGGPWDTEEDKAAVTPELRERIERLNFNDEEGGMKLRFRQGLAPLFENEPKPADKAGESVK